LNEREETMSGTELMSRATEVVKTSGMKLVPETLAMPWMARIEEHSSWGVLAHLRVTIRAEVTLNRFKVRDLLALKEGQVFESLSPATEDVPLMVGEMQLGWSEFEVQEQRIALRLTRLV
jgi:flagellar motor switch/type III secretory pathway protein FliN